MPWAKTLSTLAGSVKVMNPKPLQNNIERITSLENVELNFGNSNNLRRTLRVGITTVGGLVMVTGDVVYTARHQAQLQCRSRAQGAREKK